MAQDSIGGMWKKYKANGEEFFSISIKGKSGREINLVAWLNDKGDNPKRPDYRIFPSQPRQAGQGEARSPAPMPPREPAHADTPTGQDDFTDDISF